MTEKQIRIAVAEELGWKNINATGLFPVGMHPAYIKAGKPAVACVEALPDFCRDLNACHEMEEALSECEQYQYVNALYRISGAVYDDAFPQIHATARQRCEAFLRVKGKWKE